MTSYRIDSRHIGADRLWCRYATLSTLEKAQMTVAYLRAKHDGRYEFRIVRLVSTEEVLAL